VDADGLGRILDEAVLLGIRGVKFTGGEPLSRIDFPTLHLEAAGRGLTVSVETNGTLEPEGLWEAWGASPPAFVALSLDFAEEAGHDSFRGVAGAWRRTTRFAGRLSSAGIPFQFVMSVDRPDTGRVGAMAALASGAGASSLAVNLVQPEGRAAGRGADRIPTADLVRFIAEIDREFGPRVLPNVPPALLSLPRLVSMSTCPVLNLLGIMPDGSISFCGIAFTRRELVLGSALEEGGLRRVWTASPKVLELRRALLGPRALPCGDCIFRLSCLGHCAMGNYSMGGGFAAPNWLCERVWSEGLFPAGRLVGGAGHRAPGTGQQAPGRASGRPESAALTGKPAGPETSPARNPASGACRPEPSP
jgi:radical SAM protein with 4Fe4S-binding SPASM domain